MTKPLRVLIVEDSPDDAELMLLELRRGGFDPSWQRVETAEALRTALAQGPWDVVLWDYSLPGFDATAALALLKQTSADLPFLVVSGTIGEEQAVRLMKAGADDYLLKGRLARLAPAVERTLREAADRRARRAAEIERNRLLELLRLQIERLPLAYILFDADYRVLEWNPAAEKVFGYTKQEIMGRVALDMLVPLPVSDHVRDILRRVRAGDMNASSVNENRTKDGRIITCEWFNTPLMGPDGRFVGVISLAQDITERKRLEEELRQAKEAAEEANRAKDEFLATLAHELRNPLAPIKSAVELLRLRGLSGPEVQGSRDVIDHQVQQLTRLVDDLLDVSRISRGKIELRKQRLPVSAFVSVAVETSRPLIEASGHELSVTLSTELPLVHGDLTRLAQVVSNLLNNAAKFSSRGGHIWLTAECQQEEIVLRVRDDGIGIPAGMLSRIFEMFTQVDRSLERTTGGLGIGLPLVRRLVELHGGTVEAHSEGPGNGSEFIVRVPVVGTQQGERSPDRHSGTQVVPSRRILIADDNAEGADAIAMLLRCRGHDVRIAHDALEALELATAFQPDVALLDIGMPELNGYDLARRIRQQPWGRDIVLAALTGWGQEEDRRRSQEAGFDYHLVKPVGSDKLQVVLARAADRCTSSS